MNRNRIIIMLIILIPLISLFGVYNYMISIYEVIYTVLPDNLYADNKSEVTITATPINALGWKALFRRVEAKYTVTEGNELINIVENDESKGLLRLKAKDKTGIVRIIAKSPYALLPSPINVNIYPNITAVQDFLIVKKKV